MGIQTQTKLTPEQEEVILTAEKIRIYLAHFPIGTGLTLTQLMAMWHLNEVKKIIVDEEATKVSKLMNKPNG